MILNMHGFIEIWQRSKQICEKSHFYQKSTHLKNIIEKKTCFPAPLFVWYKNGEEIVPSPENDNLSISNEGFVSKLVIHRMGEDDEGFYACQVSNNFGSVETKAYLRVGAIQAHFNKAFAERIDAAEGKDIVLECEVSGASSIFCTLL